MKEIKIPDISVIPKDLGRFKIPSKEFDDKAKKILQLVYMALLIDGMGEKTVIDDEAQPDMFFHYYGHVGQIDFDYHSDGWEFYGSRSGVAILDFEKHFDEDYEKVEKWMMDIICGEEHE